MRVLWFPLLASQAVFAQSPLSGLALFPPAYLLAAVGLLLAVILLLWRQNRRLSLTIKEKENTIKKLEELATIDSLTMVSNRHMLDTMLEQHIAIAQRYRQLMSIIFFDIDRFKAINDQYGHSVGDEVLIALTRLVSSSIRESDVFGRWGGDEFLIILPESSQKQAKRVAKMLREKIADHPFPVVQNVSCSFGVVAYQYGDTIKTLVSRADTALYEAKEEKDSSSVI